MMNSTSIFSPFRPGNRRWARVSLTTLLLAFFVSAGLFGQSTFTVTSTADGDDTEVGTLRWAITQANGTSAASVIDFDVPGAGPHEIMITSRLPTLERTVTIDGTTQTGYVEGQQWPIEISIESGQILNVFFSSSRSVQILIQGIKIVGTLDAFTTGIFSNSFTTRPSVAPSSLTVKHCRFENLRTGWAFFGTGSVIAEFTDNVFFTSPEANIEMTSFSTTQITNQEFFAARNLFTNSRILRFSRLSGAIAIGSNPADVACQIKIEDGDIVSPSDNLAISISSVMGDVTVRDLDLSSPEFLPNGFGLAINSDANTPSKILVENVNFSNLGNAGFAHSGSIENGSPQAAVTVRNINLSNTGSAGRPSLRVSEFQGTFSAEDFSGTDPIRYLRINSTADAIVTTDPSKSASVKILLEATDDGRGEIGFLQTTNTTTIVENILFDGANAIDNSSFLSASTTFNPCDDCTVRVSNCLFKDTGRFGIQNSNGSITNDAPNIPLTFDCSSFVNLNSSAIFANRAQVFIRNSSIGCESNFSLSTNSPGTINVDNSFFGVDGPAFFNDPRITITNAQSSAPACAPDATTDCFELSNCGLAFGDVTVEGSGCDATVAAGSITAEAQCRDCGNDPITFTLTSNGTTTASTTTNPASFTELPEGTYTLTISNPNIDATVSDCDLSREITIALEDDEDPVFTCPDNQTITLAEGTCREVFTLAPPAATDNCGTVTVTATVGDSTVRSDTTYMLEKGDFTVTYTFSDESGNSVTCTQTTTIIDDQAPTATCEAVTINLEAQPGNGTQATLTADLIRQITVRSTDCANDLLTYSTMDDTTFGCEDRGQNAVTVTVSDDSGNAASCVGTVIVTDTDNLCNDAPVAVCQDVVRTLNTGNNCEAVVEPSAFDNGSSDPEGDNITFTTDQADNIYEAGVTTVVVTLSDGSLTSTCTQTVTVNAPEIDAPFAGTTVDLGVVEGSSVLRVPLQILNRGNQPLTTSGGTVSSSTGNGTFTVSSSASTNPLPAGDSTFFEIVFTPNSGQGTGETSTAMISFASNDCDEPAITFTVTVTIGAERVYNSRTQRYYPTITDAINATATVAMDTIIVSPGDYPEAVNFGTKTITCKIGEVPVRPTNQVWMIGN